VSAQVLDRLNDLLNEWDPVCVFFIHDPAAVRFGSALRSCDSSKTKFW